MVMQVVVDTPTATISFSALTSIRVDAKPLIIDSIRQDAMRCPGNSVSWQKRSDRSGFGVEALPATADPTGGPTEMSAAIQAASAQVPGSSQITWVAVRMPCSSLASIRG